MTSIISKTSLNEIVLHTLPTLYKGVIIKRPSKEIKSPYVADVVLEDETTILAHTAALGCCGLAEKESHILMIKSENPKTKCSYKIMLSQFEEKGHTIRVGIYPKLAEEITLQALRNHCIYGLRAKTIAREKTILNSRFDFVGKDENDDYYVLEVKNVPLADYVDMEVKERKKLSFDDREWNDKIAYFPDGYRKKKDATVSERAVKHITELMHITQKEKQVRTILLFVIQREDVSSFQPSRLDKIYLRAVQEAYENGVEIKTLQVVWRENRCYFLNNNLPIQMYD
jgi:DNA-binding sugar fermentation-stimulating protein